MCICFHFDGRPSEPFFFDRFQEPAAGASSLLSQGVCFSFRIQFSFCTAGLTPASFLASSKHAQIPATHWAHALQVELLLWDGSVADQDDYAPCVCSHEAIRHACSILDFDCPRK